MDIEGKRLTAERPRTHARSIHHIEQFFFERCNAVVA